MLNKVFVCHLGPPHKVVFIILIKPECDFNAISRLRLGSRVISPSSTTQNGKISSLVMPLNSLYFFRRPGVNSLHIRSWAFPRPALGSFPSTQPSWRLISPKRVFPVFLLRIEKSGETPQPLFCAFFMAASLGLKISEQVFSDNTTCSYRCFKSVG